MDILEDDQQRLTAGEQADDLRDAFEHRSDVACTGCGRLARLGKEPRELGAQRGAESLEQLDVLPDPSRAQRVHPGTERQDLLGFVRAPDQHHRAPAHRLGGELADQPALADPGLAEHGHHPTVGAECERERPA
ncbi:MAG: hypothetical protein DME04_15485 [Candidatus Rokuibacteriota bacterium]|nr:MAG: hypothetical protein DME04_15485 [Candidatus Rokubacteria bacterium]